MSEKIKLLFKIIPYNRSIWIKILSSSLRAKTYWNWQYWSKSDPWEIVSNQWRSSFNKYVSQIYRWKTSQLCLTFLPFFLAKVTLPTVSNIEKMCSAIRFLNPVPEVPPIDNLHATIEALWNGFQDWKTERRTKKYTAANHVDYLWTSSWGFVRTRR